MWLLDIEFSPEGGGSEGSDIGYMNTLNRGKLIMHEVRIGKHDDAVEGYGKGR